MSLCNVTFVQLNGVAKTIHDVASGQSLMEVARANGVEGILGDCGGSCACATCHVYVDPQWEAAIGQPDDTEASMLEMVSDVQKSNSRLSCQIQVTPALDGLRVTVAPQV